MLDVTNRLDTSFQRNRTGTKEDPMASTVSSPPLTRRQFLKGAGSLGALAALGGLPLAPRPVDAATPVAGQSLVPQPALISDDPAVHVVRRLTFGATPELVAQVRAQGVDAFIEEQLAPETIDDSAMDQMLAGFETLDLSNAEIYQNYREEAGLVVGELLAATILRAVYSRRQLFELMVDFWSNHFNIYIGDGAARYLKTTDDREVIRRHALGRFADLLPASAQSPAMLYYLDNYLSTGDAPNENYARELLELHTVGVNGGYQESDILPAARCLTGWTISRRTGNFEFVPRMHYTGPIQVMDWSSPGHSGPAAVQDGIDLLDYLAHHPSTARFLARKLCVRFVSDIPPDDLVESAAQVYLEHDTQIVPVLRHIFKSDAFAQSAGQKFRRPFELLAAGLRALDARVTDVRQAGRAAAHQLRLLGQPLFQWHPPNGYPDVAGAWLSTGGLLARWDMVQSLVLGRGPGVSVDLRALLGDALPSTAGDLVDGLADRLLFQPLDPVDRATLLDYIGLAGPERIPPAVLRYKGPQVVALLLNSTYFQVR
ncbi:MAG: DUF1800 domain-containing protein [Chloroflexi bacterium]|nr:MAG: DUF1800 domain-containing protein [Chloroflexota bacterium]